MNILWRGSIIPADIQGVNFEEVARQKEENAKKDGVHLRFDQDFPAYPRCPIS